ncbi:MAG TPA: hypothetical protein VM840_01525 [Actinomycetota bacterium]|nr:hypothetical protein [Actinomycetota bacterium]
MRKVLAIAFLFGLLGLPAVRVSAQVPPLPEKAFAGVGGERGTCVRKDARTGAVSNPYGDRCVRLRFALGPIEVQPGANSTYPMVKTIEKPQYDGYMVRIEPNMVLADGTVPNVEDMHLHHATWLSYPEYGNGPFFAAGEEKTIAEYPVPYGMPVRTSDVWYMVHMVHNATAQRQNVWITYTIDYIAKSEAENPATPGQPKIETIRPFWLDVWKNGSRASYPVYNTQRGYGQAITDPVTLKEVGTDPSSGEPWARTECTWPKQECAAFDSWVESDVGQGQPGNGKGTDIYVPQRLEGKLIGIGGHLHPGGLRVEVDAVRCTEGLPLRPGNTISTWGGLACPDTDGDGVPAEEAVRIFTSDAKYCGASPTCEDRAPERKPFSWNFRMTVTGVPRWEVNMYRDTFLRINSVYETERGSWYEGMGIAVAYVVPGKLDGLDPFTAEIDNSHAEPIKDAEGETIEPGCWDRLDAGEQVLCTRGRISKPAPIEYGRVGGEGESFWAQTAPKGPTTNDILVAGFAYLPGDISTVATAGVPQVRKDQPLTWWNVDAGANVYHSITACEYPCNGQYGIEYPLANFGFGMPGSAPRQYDSGEIGFSPTFGPATAQIPPPVGGGTVPWAQRGVAYSIVPEEYGLEPGTPYTYFCRVHPFMRGSFEVVD